MIKWSAIVLFGFAFLSGAMRGRADDSYNWPEPCTFTAHTTVGTVHGNCATIQLSEPGFRQRWSLTLQFDAASTPLASQLTPIQFADMVRTQSVQDGTDIIVLPLWGDLEVLPTDPAYLALLQSLSPIYETRPNLITITQTSNAPFTLAILFEEPENYLDLVTRKPSMDWYSDYLDSYFRMATNRPGGLSGNANVPSPPATRH
jgi:hypothetical protein